MIFLGRIILLCLLLFSKGMIAQSEKFKVVIDPGHGGKDPGKVHGNVYEKDVVLNIALLVGKELEQDPNYQIIYTRKNDEFIELYERGNIANKAKADLFISIHCNSATNKKALGAETFVLGLHANDRNFDVAKTENAVIYLEDDYQDKYAGYDINSPESFIGISIMQEEYLERSIQMAKKVQDNFKNELNRKNRGVKQAGFIVLHQTYMPSILIETGFLTNTDDRSYLTSSKGQKEIAKSIVKAVHSYRKWVKENSTDFVNWEAPEPIIYKIQIATSSRNIAPEPKNFKGLSPISKEPINALFRYYFGEETDYNNAKSLQEMARNKGFKDAFIVPFVKGKRTTMEELQKP